MTYLNHSQDVTSIDREVEKNTKIVKIHSSIFLGIPYICDGFLLWHTSASTRLISTTCDANATLSIHLQSGGAIAVQRNHTGSYLATGAQRLRNHTGVPGKPSHFFLKILPKKFGALEVPFVGKQWPHFMSCHGVGKHNKSLVQPFPDRTCKHPRVFP